MNRQSLPILKPYMEYPMQMLNRNSIQYIIGELSKRLKRVRYGHIGQQSKAKRYKMPTNYIATQAANDQKQRDIKLQKSISTGGYSSFKKDRKQIKQLEQLIQDSRSSFEIRRPPLRDSLQKQKIHQQQLIRAQKHWQKFIRNSSKNQHQKYKIKQLLPLPNQHKTLQPKTSTSQLNKMIVTSQKHKRKGNLVKRFRQHKQRESNLRLEGWDKQDIEFDLSNFI